MMETTLKAPAIAGRLTNVFGYVFNPNETGQSNAAVFVQADEPFHTSTAGSYIRAAGTDFDGMFELQEVPAGLNLHVYAETKDRSLAGTAIYEIPADPNKLPVIEVLLSPTETCEQIIRDKEENPLRNASLEMRPIVGDKDLWGGYDRYVRTDNEGILRIDGILPGMEYFLRDRRFNNTSRLSNEEWQKLFQGRVTLIPVETVDVE
jgi:hypothetical protein